MPRTAHVSQAHLVGNDHYLLARSLHALAQQYNLHPNDVYLHRQMDLFPLMLNLVHQQAP